MWVFGHLGIGSKLASPLSRKLIYGWLLLGTLLPDLIDKTLYYSLAIFTGKLGSELGLISCTRTFGHTALFVFLLALFATVRKSAPLASLALGVASHLVLDGFQDYWTYRVLHSQGESSLLLAILFPFYKSHFSVMPYDSFFDHLKSVNQPILLVTEGIGIMILIWDWRIKKKRTKSPHRNE